MGSEAQTEKRHYWDRYYAAQTPAKPAPSQFAAFIAQEASGSLLLEIGCGNGRDSLFFARQGFRVVGIDGSAAAIDKCNMTLSETGVTGAAFACATVGSHDFKSVLHHFRNEHDGPAMAYARFFLHAISDDEQEAFFADLAAVLKSGDRLALEYRTTRDAAGTKVTAAHYRRYVSPPEVFAAAGQLGFVVDYAVEGFGMAKYKEDDAYVARCILRKL